MRGHRGVPAARRGLQRRDVDVRGNSPRRPRNEHGIPEPLAKLASAIAVIVQMTDENDGVQLSLLKDHDNPDVAKLRLALDPSTMLLVNK